MDTAERAARRIWVVSERAKIKAMGRGEPGDDAMWDAITALIRPAVEGLMCIKATAAAKIRDGDPDRTWIGIERQASDGLAHLLRENDDAK